MSEQKIIESVFTQYAARLKELKQLIENHKPAVHTALFVCIDDKKMLLTEITTQRPDIEMICLLSVREFTTQICRGKWAYMTKRLFYILWKRSGLDPEDIMGILFEKQNR